MSSDSAITLYDISSGLTPQTWSPNAWKARIVLNYKRIPYKTVWISLPDIAPTITKLGGLPTRTEPDGKPLYTLPAIVDKSSGMPVLITDSLTIAEYLDEKYPDRPVFPKEGKALQYAFEAAVVDIVSPHIRDLIFPLAWKILDDRGQVYYRETRERWLGKGRALEEWSPPGPVRENHWAALEKACDTIAAMLDKNGPGVDFIAGGSEPTRADMVLVSWLAWIKACAPDDWDKRIRHWSGGRWERSMNKMEPWMAVH